MSSNTSPIRVGIIGLGISQSDFTPGLWAAKAHFPYLQASPAFRITAVANSSAKSAQTSIDHYKLGSDVKAYGSPSDIAADPNVDFIVVSVRVGTHYALTKPALLAGKDVYVEWPLAATLSQAEELTALAKEKGVKNIVGVQARASPLVIKLRSILKNNEIGTILSSTVNATFSGLPHDMFPNGAEYYLVRTLPTLCSLPPYIVTHNLIGHQLRWQRLLHHVRTLLRLFHARPRALLLPPKRGLRPQVSAYETDGFHHHDPARGARPHGSRPRFRAG